MNNLVSPSPSPSLSRISQDVAAFLLRGEDVEPSVFDAGHSEWFTDESRQHVAATFRGADGAFYFLLLQRNSSDGYRTLKGIGHFPSRDAARDALLAAAKRMCMQ
jgi:hypothetical protein